MTILDLDRLREAIHAVEETAAYAGQATRFRWHAVPCDGGQCPGHIPDVVQCYPHEGGGLEAAVAGFIATHDPVSVGRDCAKDLEVVELCAENGPDALALAVLQTMAEKYRVAPWPGTSGLKRSPKSRRPPT